MVAIGERVAAATAVAPTAGRGFDRAFQAGKLTFGFIAPLESCPDSPAPSMRDHLAMARKADDAGFTTIELGEHVHPLFNADCVQERKFR